MASLNREGETLLARLAAAESSGRKLNPEGQRLLTKLRQAKGTVSPTSIKESSPAPEIKNPSLGEGLKSDISEIGQIVKQGPMGYLKGEFAQNPSIGGAYDIANAPSQRLGERLRAAIAKIPDPERQSVVANMLLGAPKAVAEVGADFAEASLKPENVAMNAVPFAAIGKKLAKGAGALGRVQSGVDIKSGEKLFQDPGALFTKTKKAAGEALGAVRKGLGFVEERKASEVLSDIEGKRGLAFANGVVRRLEKLSEDITGEVKEGVKIPEILKALQNVQRKLRKTPYSDSETRYELANVGRYLTDQLKSIPGSEVERKAAAQFARSSLASEFRRALPVTKAGDISVGRTSFLPLMAGGGAFAGGPLAAVGLAAAQSPALAGLEISAAGGLYKAASSILQNPKLRTAILALLNQEGSDGNSPSR